MTPFDGARYDRSPEGGDTIPETARTNAPGEAHPEPEVGAPQGRSARAGEPVSGGGGALARLDRLVQTLVDRYRAVRAERDALQAELAEREERIRSLDARLSELAHSREEAAKRLGQLVERIDRLDAQLAPATAPPAASPPE